MAMGLRSVPAAFGLLIISIGATLTDGIKRIADWRSIDKSNWLDDILYLPEVLYPLLLLSVILAGLAPFRFAGAAGSHQRSPHVRGFGRHGVCRCTAVGSGQV